MAEDDQPKRGRGRPRLNPVGAVRRNVTVQVSSELYELLSAATESSGLSISREIEARLQSSFDNASAEDAYLKEFHGLDGMIWGKASADLYRRELTKLVVETGWIGDGDMPEGFADKLLERTRAGLGAVAEEWSNAMLLSQMMSKVKSVDIGPLVERFLDLSPAFKARIENLSKRRAARDKNSAEAPDDEE